MIEWNAWAPGLVHKEDWASYIDEALNFDYAVEPDVSFIKPMVRRRLSYMARAVFANTKPLVDTLDVAVPMVFASRYGDLNKTVELLTAISDKRPLSSTAFGLSVHNATAGLFSQLLQWKTPYSVIAAGNNTLQAGLLEAYSQSKTLKKTVLLTYYDDVLPVAYDIFSEHDLPAICLSLLVDYQCVEQFDLLNFIAYKSSKEEQPVLTLIKWLLKNGF